MKVYLFNVTSGLYEGEDYRDAAEMREDDGITSLAPPVYQPGQVPVYDRNRGIWQLRPIELLRKAVQRNDF
jgi:hypothetical protein